MNMARNSKKAEFVVYIGPADRQTDLQPLKIYRLAPAQAGDPKNYVRVIDDSGEDYLYPHRYFEPIAVSKRVQAASLKHAG